MTASESTAAPAPADPAAAPELAAAGGAAPVTTPAAARFDLAAALRRHLPELAALLLAAAALLVGLMLWQKLSNIQEQLARQSADASAQSVEARSLAKQALELAREAAVRQAVTEAKLNEVSLQRSQIDELMQSLSRARDENLVVDIESALRLAQQQAQLTGSIEPLLAALKTAEQRIARAAQPRLNNLKRALIADIDRIKTVSLSDTPGLLVRLDELVRLADELPLANAVGRQAQTVPDAAEPAALGNHWLVKVWSLFYREARALVRVSSTLQPEAALLSPEQSFFVRENLKLRLLNARLGLLARQLPAAHADLGLAMRSLNQYFDVGSRKTQTAAALLQQVQGEMKNLELPRLDATLAALTTAAAGR